MSYSYRYKFNNISVEHMNESKEDLYTYEVHNHHHYEFLFFPRSFSEMVVENDRIHLSDNTGLLIRPAQTHYLADFAKGPYDGYIIRFSPEILSSNLKAKLSTIGPFFCASNDSFLNILERFDYYSTKYSGEDLCDIFTSLIIELLIELCFSINQTQPKHSSKKMVDILDYINSNISDKITLDSLCKQFYQSKTWLYHAFMENVGMPPIKYIESKRLALANELILTGNKPTKIYSTCGYSDYSAFYRAYIAYYGHPPTTMKPKKSTKRSKKSSTKKQVEQ